MMKKRINNVLATMLLVAVFVSCATSYHAPSGNPNYVPFKKFHGDTLAYAKKNFDENREFYFGKTADTLFNDIDSCLPVQVENYIGEQRGSHMMLLYGLDFQLTGENVTTIERNYGRYTVIHVIFTENPELSKFVDEKVRNFIKNNNYSDTTDRKLNLQYILEFYRRFKIKQVWVEDLDYRNY
jgi:hypothetical protein